MRALFLAFCWFTIASTLSAQADKRKTSSSTPANFIFERLNVESEAVKHGTWWIMQDRQGFMWFATGDGLNRYDGKTVKTFKNNPKDSTSLAINRLWDLLEDIDGKFLVATYGAGLRVFDPVTEKFSPFKWRDAVYITTGSAFGAMRDSKKRLWVRTREDGFYVFDDTAKTALHFLHDPSDPNSLGSNVVTQVTEDEHDIFWIATSEAGVERFDYKTKTFTHYKYKFDNPNTVAIDIIAETKKLAPNELWVATFGGLVRFNTKTGEVRPYWYDPKNPRSPSGKEVWRTLKDAKGRIWVGTSNGLNLYDEQKDQFIRFDYDPYNPLSFSGNFISHINQDATGTLWFASSYAVINKLDAFANAFQLIPIRPRAIKEGNGSLGQITDVIQDKGGKIWVSLMGGGVYRYDPANQSFNSYLPGERIEQLLEDSKGGIWSGSLKYDPQKDKFYDYFAKNQPSINLNRRGGLYKDKKDRLWHCSGSAFYVKAPDADTFTLVPVAPKPKTVSHFFEDSKGRIWISSQGEGIFVYTPDMKLYAHYWNKPNQKPLFSDNHIFDIQEDRFGKFWITTQRGLDRLTPTTNKDYPIIKNFQYTGFYNDPGILRLDDQGNLWTIDEFGVCKINPMNDSIICYNNFVSAERPTTINTLSNGLWAVGGYWGLYTFYPDSLKKNTIPPPIVLTDFRLFNQSVPIRGSFADTLEWKSPLTQSIVYTDRIDLLYWQNDISFEFAALNYTQPEKNQYQYKLEGYKDKWISTTADQAFAYYTNLSPGKYTFHVTGSNNDGVWNKAGKSIIIIIHPPWWRTWWAYLAYAIIIFFIIRSIYLFQLSRRLARAEAVRLKELDIVKSRLFTNVTHEFRTPLTVILGMAQQVKNDPKSWFSEGINAIIRSGQQLLQLVNQMMDLSRLEAGNLPVQYQQGNIIDFLGYLVQSFQSYAASKQIDLQFIKKTEAVQMDFAPDVLSKIVHNLISNAIKYTPERGQVIATVNRYNKTLEINIQDTGIGIPSEHLPHIFDRFYQVDNSSIRQQEGTGIGLALVKELIDVLHGTIEVNSEPGQFTHFKITLPITNNAPRLSFDNIEKTESGLSPDFQAFTKNWSDNDDAPIALIIEDNQDVSHYIAVCLQDKYQIHFAINGRIGVEKAIEIIPDIIICDIMMPEMDGYEVCHILKNDERTSHIPIVMLTAKADIDAKIEGIRQGADAYLTKPFDKEELFAQIHNLLEIRRKLQAYYLAQAGLKIKGAAEAIPASKTSLENALEHTFIQKMKTLVEADLSKQWEVPELAQQLLVSVSQLHRKLEALTGMHTTEFVRYVRLTKARQLLLDLPEEKIAAIAYEVGFTSPNEFTRRFKEVFQMTPGEWRKHKK